MSIWTPSRADLNRREQHRSELVQQAYTDAATEYWTKEVKQIDEYLEVFRAKPDAELLRPGYWYIMRHNPGAPVSLICIEGGDGEYLEPSSHIFHLLREGDLWNAEAQRDRANKARLAEEAEVRRKQRETEDRVEEFADRLRALTRVSVSMNRSAKWSQNEQGRRGRSA